MKYKYKRDGDVILYTSEGGCDKTITEGWTCSIAGVCRVGDVVNGYVIDRLGFICGSYGAFCDDRVFITDTIKTIKTPTHQYKVVDRKIIEDTDDSRG